MNHLTIALVLAGAPLHAAPFVVCNLDNNNRVIVDLADNTMQLNDSNWVYAQVQISDEYFIAEYASRGYFLGVIIDGAGNQAYWKSVVPDSGAVEGKAICNYQER